MPATSLPVPPRTSASVDTVQRLFRDGLLAAAARRFTLQAPDGTMLTSSSPNVAYAPGDWASTFVRRLAVAAAAPGTWTLTHGGPGDPLRRRRTGGEVNLEMAAAKESYKVNETVTLSRANTAIPPHCPRP